MMPRSGSRLLLGLTTALIVAFALASQATGTGPQTTRVSVSDSRTEGAGLSQGPAISDDGRFVVFWSDAPNLVPDDVNGRDVFVHDRGSGLTQLVSISTQGVQANGPASWPDISGDGRFVVFESTADNLVFGDTNEASDIFCFDRLNRTLERVSLANDGSQAEGDSYTPSTSADGRYVTFTSLAENLVDSASNDERDVFVRDLQAGTTELISVATDGTLGDAPSGGFGAGPGRVTGDGRFVVFGSFASTLVSDDTNIRDDIFLRDRDLETTVRVSINDADEEGPGHSLWGDVSDDGRFVVFHSASPNFVADDTNGVLDIFLRDVTAGTITRLSQGINQPDPDQESRFARISRDGAIITYESMATNLVDGDTNNLRDIFIQDRESGAVSRVSKSTEGLQANSHSSFATIDADGDFGSYQSLATNLVSDDFNEAFDVFVWEKAGPLGMLPSPTTPNSATATATPTATPTPSLVGDVNCSGDVTSIDAVLVLQFTASLLGALSCQEAGDANANGVVDAIDATLILQLTAGFFESLPP